MFRTEPKVLPAGESIVWALAKEKGTIAKSLRYPAEDGVYENGKMDKPWLQRFFTPRNSKWPRCLIPIRTAIGLLIRMN